MRLLLLLLLLPRPAMIS